MRNILVTLVLLTLVSAGVQAQTEKGRWTAGAQVGNLRYSGNNVQYRSRNFSGSLSPSAGYFVANNLAVGVSLPVTYTRNYSIIPGNVNNDASGFNIELSPFVRYYVGSAKLRPFLNASVGFQHLWSVYKGFGTTETQRYDAGYTTYSAGGGVAYFINNTVSLDASLTYANYLGGAPNPTRSSIGLNIGFRLFFGK